MKLDGFRVSDSQKDSVKVALDEYGYSVDDFEWIHAGDGVLSGGDDRLGTETVYVIYKPTGFRRMYDGADWETEFAADLKNQIFKPVS